MKDKVTGGSYDAELIMYMKYHGLTLEEAQEVLRAESHAERDEVFARVLARQLRQS